jgi:hypothetical protein
VDIGDKISSSISPEQIVNISFEGRLSALKLTNCLFPLTSQELFIIYSGDLQPNVYHKELCNKFQSSESVMCFFFLLNV